MTKKNLNCAKYVCFRALHKTAAKPHVVYSSSLLSIHSFCLYPTCSVYPFMSRVTAQDLHFHFVSHRNLFIRRREAERRAKERENGKFIVKLIMEDACRRQLCDTMAPFADSFPLLKKYISYSQSLRLHTTRDLFGHFTNPPCDNHTEAGKS